tara:strand:- start:16 stop:228 length:213 start_codon:yes stop_codon:yes gene_type:complete
MKMNDVTARPDPMIPCKPGAEDLVAMQNRNTWMTMLFMLEGRDNPDHPQRGLYTGLHKKHFSTFPGTDEN